MEKPCEICGDVGFDPAIRICSKCEDTREHAYCMRVIYEGDPDKWVCEKCETPTPKCLLKPVPTQQTNFTGTRFSIKKPPENTKTRYLTPAEAIGLESGAVKHYGSTRKPYLSSRTTMNMSSPGKEPIGSMPMPSQYIAKPNPPIGPPGFTKPLNPRTMPSSSPVQNLSTSKEKEKAMVHAQHSSKESPARTGFTARDSQVSNSPVAKEKMVEKEKAMVHAQNPSKESPARTGFTARDSRVSNSSVAKEKKKEKPMVHEHNASKESPVRTGFAARDSRVSNSPKAKERMKESSRYLQWETELPLPSRKLPRSNIPSGHSSQRGPQGLAAGRSGVRTNPQPRNVDSGERESAEVAMKLDKCLPNHPSASPTWKGNFKIPSNIVPHGHIDGLQAHPPCKVHSKVYYASKQMPNSLKFEPFPRLSLWTDLFEDDAPAELDIGLYFLPSRRNEPSYACLVEYLDRDDMLLKTQLDGPELLILSSKHLDKKSQRLNQKHFLWGMFRSSEDDIAPSTSASASNTAALAHNSDSRIEALPAWGERKPHSDNRPDQGNVGVSGKREAKSDSPKACDEDMEVDMIGGLEVGSADVVVPKPKEAHLDPSERYTKVLVERKSDTVLGFSSPLKVKKEHKSSTVTFEEMERDFNRQLQKSFDRFTMIAGVKLEVKGEREN